MVIYTSSYYSDVGYLVRKHHYKIISQQLKFTLKLSNFTVQNW